MDDNLFLSILGKGQFQIEKVTDCNQYSQKFGVSLSEKDALILLEARKNSLKEQERIEFAGGILPKLIFAFCDSPFIYQDNYVDTLEALQDIFYLYQPHLPYEKLLQHLLLSVYREELEQRIQCFS